MINYLAYSPVTPETNLFRTFWCIKIQLIVFTYAILYALQNTISVELNPEHAEQTQ